MQKTRKRFFSDTHMKGLLYAVLALFLSVAFSSPQVFGEIYKWQDESGQWHFSDQPPPESQDESWWDEKGGVIRTEKPPSQTVLEDPDAKIAVAPPEPVGKGVLFRIVGGGMSPSYVLGTIHSEDPRVLNFSYDLESAFKQKDVFLMEVVLDETALLEMSTSMLLLDGRTLQSILGDDLYRETARAVRKRLGIPEIAMNQMKPWAVMAALSVPPPKSGQFMDMVLYEKARQQGKQVVGLETADEQIRVFDSMPMEDQIALLKETLKHADELPETFEQLTLTYLSGDLEKVADLAEKFMNYGDPVLTERVLKRLNEDRNTKMVDQMLPYLVAGDAFVAVGALHLPGQKGILNLLRQKGFQTTPVR